MEGAEAPDQIDAVDADDFAAGEDFSQNVEGYAVVGIVKGGDEDEAIGDVEVGVTGGQTLAAEDDRARHEKLDKRELLAGGGARGLKTGEILGQGGVVEVARIGLDGGDDDVGRDEAGDVVDVAVGVVAGDAAMEPEHLIDAEKIGEDLFELFAAEAGVALLHFAEKTFFRGEQETGAVDVDGATFQHYAAAPRTVLVLNRGLPPRATEQPGHAGGEPVVEAPVIVFGPGVEMPVGETHLTLGVADEDGAGVADPDAVGGPVVEGYTIEVGAGAGQHGGNAALGGWVLDDELDALALRREGGRSRRRPRGWAETCRASLRGCAARRARWLRAAPTRRAFDSPGRAESRRAWRDSPESGVGGIEEAAGDGRVGVDAAVAEEGPVAAGFFDEGEVDGRRGGSLRQSCEAWAMTRPKGSATKRCRPRIRVSPWAMPSPRHSLRRAPI